MKLDNPLSYNKCFISSVSFYTDFVLHNVQTDQVVVMNGGRTDESIKSIPQGTYDFETIIAILNVSDALFELAYSEKNAFHFTVTHYYSIDFTKAPEIQSIFRLKSSMLQKGVDNLRRYFLSTTYDQVVVTNSAVRHVLSIPTGNYTYLEFIEAVGSIW